MGKPCCLCSTDNPRGHGDALTDSPNGAGDNLPKSAAGSSTRRRPRMSIWLSAAWSSGTSRTESSNRRARRDTIRRFSNETSTRDRSDASNSEASNSSLPPLSRMKNSGTPSRNPVSYSDRPEEAPGTPNDVALPLANSAPWPTSKDSVNPWRTRVSRLGWVG
jgi:hypothetical protein